MNIKILACQIIGPTAAGSAGPVPTALVCVWSVGENNVGGTAAGREFDAGDWPGGTDRVLTDDESDADERQQLFVVSVSESPGAAVGQTAPDVTPRSVNDDTEPAVSGDDEQEVDDENIVASKRSPAQHAALPTTFTAVDDDDDARQAAPLAAELADNTDQSPTSSVSITSLFVSLGEIALKVKLAGA